MSLLLLSLSCHTWLPSVPCQAPSHDTSPCSSSLTMEPHLIVPDLSQRKLTLQDVHIWASPGQVYLSSDISYFLYYPSNFKKNDTLSVGTSWLSCKHLYFPMPLLSLTRLLLVPCLFFIFYHSLLWWSSLFYFHCLSPFCTHHMDRNLLYTISTISWCLRESIGKCAKNMTMNHFFSFWAYHAVCR